jgi:hypothetical protein
MKLNEIKSANLKLIAFTKHALSVTWLVHEFFFVYGVENMKSLNTLRSKNPVFVVLKRDKMIATSVI